MALTIQKLAKGPIVVGDRKFTPANIALDASYPTGGYTLTPADFGGRKIEGVFFIGGNGDTTTFVPQYDYNTGKVKVFRSGGTNQPLNEASGDLSASAFRAIVVVTE